MGEISIARHPLHRMVAIKILLSALAGDAELRRRIARETNAPARIA